MRSVDLKHEGRYNIHRYLSIFRRERDRQTDRYRKRKRNRQTEQVSNEEREYEA